MSKALRRFDGPLRTLSRSKPSSTRKSSARTLSGFPQTFFEISSGSLSTPNGINTRRIYTFLQVAQRPLMQAQFSRRQKDLMEQS